MMAQGRSGHAGALARLAFCLMVSAASGAVQAAVVFDDFTDGVLGPGWLIEFPTSIGWNYVEAGTNLIVSDVLPPKGTTDAWSLVRISKDFAPMGDFNLTCSFSWDSDGDVNAMQLLLIRLCDAACANAIGLGFADSWLTDTGSKLALTSDGGPYLSTGSGSLPLAGSADVEIRRTGSNVEYLWDGTPLWTITTSTPVTRVGLEFYYYSHTGTDGTSLFGNENVDLISMVIPEPAALSLLALGTCFILRRRRR